MIYLYKIGINHAVQLLLLVFLAITFLQSGYDKISDWKGNLNFLTEHFSKTFIKNKIRFFLGLILFSEIIAGFLSVAGIVQIYYNQQTFIGFLASVISAKILLILLFGQRIAKDYEGAKTIAVYFIVSIMAIYFLQ